MQVENQNRWLAVLAEISPLKNKAGYEEEKCCVRHSVQGNQH
jgi:hypothetical protein